MRCEMKVKEHKQQLEHLSDNTDIQICVGRKLYQIDNITTVIDMDTNIGSFVINVKEDNN